MTAANWNNIIWRIKSERNWNFIFLLFHTFTHLCVCMVFPSKREKFECALCALCALKTILKLISIVAYRLAHWDGIKQLIKSCFYFSIALLVISTAGRSTEKWKKNKKNSERRNTQLIEQITAFMVGWGRRIHNDIYLHATRIFRLISHVIHARAHYVIQCVMDIFDVFPNFNASTPRLFPHFPNYFQMNWCKTKYGRRWQRCVDGDGFTGRAVPASLARKIKMEKCENVPNGWFETFCWCSRAASPAFMAIFTSLTPETWHIIFNSILTKLIYNFVIY